MYTDHPLVLLPPLVVITTGLITKNIFLCLASGILSAFFTLAYLDSFFNSVHIILLRFWQTSEIGTLTTWSDFIAGNNLLIFFFLAVIGVLIYLLSHTGGAYAYSSWIKKKVHTPASAQVSSLFLSTTLFIDDYLSCLLVGSVMHPITDAYRISRIKLAFLVDAMTESLTILIPFSSWLAALVGFFKQAGISTLPSANTIIIANPFLLYLSCIPYLFYSFILISTLLLMIYGDISFGMIAHHNRIAQKTGNMHGGKKQRATLLDIEMTRNGNNATLLDFFFPIGLLTVAIFCAFLATGGFSLCGGTRTLVDALQNARAPYSLFIASIIILTVSLLFFIIRKRIMLHETLPIIGKGVLLTLPAIGMLFIAWTFAALLIHDLKTGHYIASLFIDGSHAPFLPLLFFITSSLIAFILGSSWATIALMLSLAIPMLTMHASPPLSLDQIPFLFPVLGALLSGAVLGDHVSPLSDTTIMSSASCGAHHADHVISQLTSTLPVIMGTALSFLMLGTVCREIPYGPLWSLLAGIGVSWTLALGAHTWESFTHRPSHKGE